MFFCHKSCPCLAAAGLIILLSLAACSDQTGKMEETVGLESELLDADRAFAREVAEAEPADRGRVWAGWFASEGRQILPGRIVQGSKSIAELMDPVFASTGNELTWDPDLASASSGGDLGWTSGRYKVLSTTQEGQIVGEGRYVTIWQREKSGTWKVAVDLGVPDPEK